MASLRNKLVINRRVKKAHEMAGVEFVQRTIDPMVLAVRALNLTAKNSLPSELKALGNARKAVAELGEMYIQVGGREKRSS